MITTSEIAKNIVDAFKFRGFEQDAEFISASGSDFGRVEAWDIADGKSVVAYGDNAVTNYYICDEAATDTPLSVFLLTDGIGDNPLERAAVLGPDGISQVGADYVGDVKVIIQRHRYGSCGEVDSYGCLTAEKFNADWDLGTVFTSAAEAAAAIEEAWPADNTYMFDHNEYARRSYYIVVA